jgi:hypothetical protein
MSSPLFLSSYVLYKSAVTAFLDVPENARLELSDRDVMRAYVRATAGLSRQDECDLVAFVHRLLLVPEEARKAAARRADMQRTLDREIVVAGARLVDSGLIIGDDEFLRRARMTREMLDEKLAGREIFVMPDEVHFLNGDAYIPAFFADERYDAKVLYAVSGALGACNGVQKYRFFTTACDALGNRTPLDVIALQELAKLADAVKAFSSGLRKRWGP